MLKHIKPEQVRLGMFIDTIDGDFEGKRFWKAQFVLKCPKEVQSLRISRVKDIVINTGKGANVIIPAIRADRHAHEKKRRYQLARAHETMRLSKPLLKAMLDGVTAGGSVSLGDAMQVVDIIVDCMTDSYSALTEITRLKTRDEHTFVHSIAVAAFMVHLGRSIKADEATIHLLGLGGLLHDLGKIRIPLQVLNKAGRLSDQEMGLVREHPLAGFEILSRQGNFPKDVLDICLNHHERLDGKGYPNGLSGDQLTLPVRIATICDVYDALTSKRPYKEAWEPRDAADFMLRQKGQFDSKLLHSFFHNLTA